MAMKGRRGVVQETPRHHKRHDGQQSLMVTASQNLLLSHQNPNPMRGRFTKRRGKATNTEWVTNEAEFLQGTCLSIPVLM